jgi:hypothetical protein
VTLFADVPTVREHRYHQGMTTHLSCAGDEPLVVTLTVLYEHDIDGLVIAHVPEVLGAVGRGADRPCARRSARLALRDLILGYLEPVDTIYRELGAERLRLVIEP